MDGLFPLITADEMHKLDGDPYGTAYIEQTFHLGAVRGTRQIYLDPTRYNLVETRTFARPGEQATFNITFTHGRDYEDNPFWDKTELYCTHDPSEIFLETMEEIDLLGYLQYDPIVGHLALSLVEPL